MPTIQQLLQSATARLKHSDNALLDAQCLLCESLHCNTAHLAAWPDKTVDDVAAEQFERMLQRREQGEPVAYIRGSQEFFSRDFVVNINTLIPRPETECLVEFVLEQFDANSALDVIDLGTGSGAIAITLACERRAWNITATDISDDALGIARDNAARHKADIHFRQADWFAGIDDCFDVIVSNPPYVAENDSHLDALKYEPVSALVSGKDGLDDIRRLASLAAAHLLPGGWLMLEHGYDQQAAVSDILQSAGLDRIQTHKDLAGLARFTVARLSD